MIYSIGVLIDKAFITENLEWLNSNISNYPLYIKSWHNQGISTVGDVIDSNYNILPIEEITNIHNVRTDFLTYLRMKTNVTKYISKYNIPQINNVSYTRPYVPYLVSKLRKNKKNIYKALINIDNCSNFFNLKWEIDLGQQIDVQTYSTAFRICFYTIENNYYGLGYLIPAKNLLPMSYLIRKM